MKPSEKIKAKAEAAWKKRIAGRGLPEAMQGNLLNMELILATLDYIDEHAGDAEYAAWSASHAASLARDGR